MAGAAIQWLRDELKVIERASETETIARSLKNNGGVYMVPTFTGLGAPYWDMYSRGLIIGLTRGTGRAHIVRAALESIAYQSADVYKRQRNGACNGYHPRRAFMKSKRQALIREIVESQSIQTQEELAEALRMHGMVVTQATVSRDIKEMHLLKVPVSYTHLCEKRIEQIDLDTAEITLFEEKKHGLS